jgi:hypothetical protein
MSREKLFAAVEIVAGLDVPITSVPMKHLFAAMFAGKHGDYGRAFDELRTGLAHTATCIELIAWQARFSARAGRVHDAVSFARDLRIADPADRNTNLLLVKMLFLGGYRREAEKEAEIFAGQENGRELLYLSQFNIYNLKSGFSALRAGDIAFAKRMYQGVLAHFDQYRKNEFNYFTWFWKKSRALIELIEGLERIERCPVFGRAVEMLIAIAILDGKVDAVKEVAKRAATCEQPIAVAYCCVVFVRLGLRLPALRCYLKVTGSFGAYLAAPSIAAMVAGLGAANPIVRGVITEEYKPISGPPRTAEELFADGRGKMVLGDVQGAVDSLTRAATQFELPFKKALEIFVFATVLAGNEEVRVSVGDAIREKYPQYELLPEHTEDPDCKFDID